MSEKEIKMPFSEYESLVAQANDARNALKEGKTIVEGLEYLHDGYKYATQYYTNDEIIVGLTANVNRLSESIESLDVDNTLLQGKYDNLLSSYTSISNHWIIKLLKIK